MMRGEKRAEVDRQVAELSATVQQIDAAREAKEEKRRVALAEVQPDFHRAAGLQLELEEIARRRANAVAALEAARGREAAASRDDALVEIERRLPAWSRADAELVAAIDALGEAIPALGPLARAVLNALARRGIEYREIVAIAADHRLAVDWNRWRAPRAEGGWTLPGIARLIQTEARDVDSTLEYAGRLASFPETIYGDRDSWRDSGSAESETLAEANG